MVVKGERFAPLMVKVYENLKKIFCAEMKPEKRVLQSINNLMLFSGYNREEVERHRDNLDLFK